MTTAGVGSGICDLPPTTTHRPLHTLPTSLSAFPRVSLPTPPLPSALLLFPSLRCRQGATPTEAEVGKRQRGFNNNKSLLPSITFSEFPPTSRKGSRCARNTAGRFCETAVAAARPTSRQALQDRCSCCKTDQQTSSARPLYLQDRAADKLCKTAVAAARPTSRQAMQDRCICKTDQQTSSARQLYLQDRPADKLCKTAVAAARPSSRQVLQDPHPPLGTAAEPFTVWCEQV